MDGAFSVNYALSFESPNGLSGAPLLLLRGDKVLVGGLIYKNKSTYFLIDQETTTDKEGRIEKEISYRDGYGTLLTSWTKSNMGSPTESETVGDATASKAR